MGFMGFWGFWAFGLFGYYKNMEEKIKGRSK